MQTRYPVVGNNTPQVVELHEVLCQYCDKPVSEEDQPIHQCGSMPRWLWRWQNVEVSHRRKTKRALFWRKVFGAGYLLYVVAMIALFYLTGNFFLTVIFPGSLLVVIMLFRLDNRYTVIPTDDNFLKLSALCLKEIERS